MTSIENANLSLKWEISSRKLRDTTTDYILRCFARQIHDDKIIRIQNPIQLDRYGEVYPDAAIVRNRRYADRHPLPEDTVLIIEIADTTLDYDRGTKLPLYAAQRIPEVWIVNVRDRCVEVYRTPESEGRRYQQAERIASGTLNASEIPEVKLALDQLFSSGAS